MYLWPTTPPRSFRVAGSQRNHQSEFVCVTLSICLSSERSLQISIMNGSNSRNLQQRIHGHQSGDVYYHRFRTGAKIAFEVVSRLVVYIDPIEFLPSHFHHDSNPSRWLWNLISRCTGALPNCILPFSLCRYRMLSGPWGIRSMRWW